MGSPESSMEGSGVSWPISRAAIWSALTPRSPVRSGSAGPTQESQVPAMMP
jgi:hypothetical protein